MTDLEIIVYAGVAALGVPIYLLTFRIMKRWQHKRMFRD